MDMDDDYNDGILTKYLDNRWLFLEEPPVTWSVDA